MTTLSERLNTVYREHRLIRKEWARTGPDGRQMLCILTALANDASARSETCPASVAPQWLARLLPWIDDAGTEERWPGFVKRLITVADSLPKMGRREDMLCRMIALDEARTHTKDADVIACIERTTALCKRATDGDEPTDDEWRAPAPWTAREAARAAAVVVAVMAWASAARAAAWTAAWAASPEGAAASPEEAAASPEWTEARASAEAAASAARAAAPEEAEAADRMIDKMLSVFEDFHKKGEVR